jgi:hypothetical protein
LKTSKEEREGDLGVEGRIILKLILDKWDVGGINEIHLSQCKVQWWASTNMETNFQDP